MQRPGRGRQRQAEAGRHARGDVERSKGCWRGCRRLRSHWFCLDRVETSCGIVLRSPLIFRHPVRPVHAPALLLATAFLSRFIVLTARLHTTLREIQNFFVPSSVQPYLLFFFLYPADLDLLSLRFRCFFENASFFSEKTSVKFREWKPCQKSMFLRCVLFLHTPLSSMKYLPSRFFSRFIISPAKKELRAEKHAKFDGGRWSESPCVKATAFRRSVCSRHFHPSVFDDSIFGKVAWKEA